MRLKDSRETQKSRKINRKELQNGSRIEIIGRFIEDELNAFTKKTAKRIEKENGCN